MTRLSAFTLAAHLLVLSLALVFSVEAFAGVTLSERMPTAGREVRVHAFDEGGAPLSQLVLEATYYPGSELARTLPACTTDEGGHCVWTPESPGVVHLNSAGAEVREVVSVKYQRMPFSALVVFLSSGLLLIGGMIFGVVRLGKSADY